MKQFILTHTPPYKVEVYFPNIKTTKPPEYPEITIEGRVAKNSGKVDGAKYDKDNHTFSVRIAQQYDPNNPKVAWYYTDVAEGEAADAAYGLYLNNKGIPVHVTGWDISESMKLDKGTKGVIKAEFIERLPQAQNQALRYFRREYRLLRSTSANCF